MEAKENGDNYRIPILLYGLYNPENQNLTVVWKISAEEHRGFTCGPLDGIDPDTALACIGSNFFPEGVNIDFRYALSIFDPDSTGQNPDYSFKLTPVQEYLDNYVWKCRLSDNMF